MAMNIYLPGGYYLWLEEAAACGVHGCESAKRPTEPLAPPWRPQCTSQHPRVSPHLDLNPFRVRL